MANALVNGIRIHYEVVGEGKPLVLAHGHGATLDVWQPQVDALATRYRIIVYDTRGHGRTDAPPDPLAYSLDAYVEDQRALMDRLAITEAFVGGTSMGGMIALQYALTYPERVRALLLFDTCASNRHFARSRSKGALARWLRRRWRRASGGAFTVFHLAVRAAPGVPPALARLAPAALRRYLTGLRAQTPVGRRGAWQAILARTDLEGRLSEIRAPTLVVAGERDRLVEGARYLGRHIPDARLVLMRAVGHGANHKNATAFNQVLLEFLAAVDDGRPVAGEVVL